MKANFSQRDPHDYQLIVLTALLCIGLWALQFPVTLIQIATIASVTLLMQWFGDRCHGYASCNWKSALITALSLCLLLRANALWPLVLAASVAIGTKFLFRIQGRHLFNPANIGIVASSLLLDGVWVSPGQWGSATWLVLLLACLAVLVLTRAQRWDVSLVFLVTYAAILIGRAVWLGDPFAIPLHQLQSGAVLLFTFFMLSDPRTTPAARRARCSFAMVLAVVTATLQFGLYLPQSMFYALALMTPLRFLPIWR